MYDDPDVTYTNCKAYYNQPAAPPKRPMRFRFFHKLYANVCGYFWVPCPLCNRHFGGHEWRTDLGHFVPREDGLRGICPACGEAIAKARGER